jgi:hypothetical protein
VSIIIPVYNGSNYLGEAIDSALSQTYRNIEVIVVNDGSDDGNATKSIALSYGNTIRYFSKPNGGVSTALNFGIREMKGEYFSWLSHDDKYKPDKIEKQMGFLAALEDNKTILYGSYEIINHKSKKIDIVQFDKLYPISQLNKPLFPIFRGLANGCSMLVHRSHFERVGQFDESLRTTQDYDMWFRMFRGAKVSYCPGIYLQMRFHSEQTGRKDQKHISECDELWCWMLREITSSEMIDIDGSENNFAQKTLTFMKRFTFNIKAVNYIEKSHVNEKVQFSKLLKIYNYKIPVTMSTGGLFYLIRRMVSFVAHRGISETIKRVIGY